MSEEFFCPTCGGSYGEAGNCSQCGERLETNGDAERINGDDIDERLLQESHGKEMRY